MIFQVLALERFLSGPWPRDRITKRTVHEVKTKTGVWGHNAPLEPTDGWFLKGLMRERIVAAFARTRVWLVRDLVLGPHSSETFVMKTTIRKRLRSQLVESWKTVLEKQYAFQWINSERSLQAYFATSLDTVLRSTQKAATELQRRLFIEPTIRIGKGKKVYECKPDVVVCNKNKIIAVIELKYQPKSKPT